MEKMDNGLVKNGVGVGENCWLIGKSNSFIKKNENYELMKENN